MTPHTEQTELGTTDSPNLEETREARDVITGQLAQFTENFSGADLASLVNEAAVTAARADALHVGKIHFEEALAKVKKSRFSRLSTQPGVSEEEEGGGD